jgi:sulfofructose kinase
MTRVTCVGICTLDLVLRVDRFPIRAGKYRAGERREVGGGVAANAAATVAALGGAASLVSCVGSDPTGTRILEELDARGVRTAGVRRVEGGQSPLSAVLVDASGERWIVNHASADLFDRADLPTDSEFEKADCVLADMRWPAATVVGLESARRRGVPAVLDCDHDPSRHPEVLAAASHAVFSLATLVAFTGEDDPATALAAALAYTEGLPMATDGGEGVHWLEDGRHRHVPAFAVDVVDTLGAGDVFHGAFALAMAEGQPLHEAVVRASATAALKCTRFGGRDGIPSQIEVDRFLESAR